jgi:hypothetical protein
LRYIARAAEGLGPDELRQAVRQALTAGDEIMSTIAEQWVQNRASTRDSNRAFPKAKLFALRRLLTRRFGPLPGWAEEKITLADRDELESWVDRVLEAQSLEDVFNQG